MDCDLNMDNNAIRAAVRRFLDREVRPHVMEWEEQNIFPREIYRQMGSLGFLGATFPKKYGGSELGFLNLAIIAEEVSRVHEALGSAFNMNAMTCPYTVLNWGSETLRKRYVSDWICGKKIGFFGLTEAGGGTDVLGGMMTTAVLKNDHYVLTGAKQFITLGTVADVGLIFCKTDPKGGHHGISAFLVETDRPGFKASLIRTRVLGESWPTSAIFLDNVVIPSDHLVGEEGQGFQIAMNALDYGRLVVGARCVGIGQAALDDMTAYAKERHAFGQPIGKFQQIQSLIANTVVEVESARLTIYRLADALEKSGSSQPRLSSQAKYYAAEVAYRAAERAFEVFGGYAVTDDYPIARHLNTAALLRTGEGSANLQRVLIAEDILGYRSSDKYRVPQRFPLWAISQE